METIAMIAITTMLGYSLSDKKSNETIRNVAQTDNVTDKNPEKMSEAEKPNSLNIYNSTRASAINDEILQMSINNYKKSENPSLTGVLPPIYNSYSSIGNDTILSNSDNVNKPTLAQINNKNRYSDPTQNGNVSAVGARPVFTSMLNLDTNAVDNSFSNFGSGVETSQQISLLTGKPIEREHTNMVPFFGGNVKQNVEKYTNVHKLDNYTGNTSTFIHKKEQGQRFENFKQDINGTPMFTANVETDRFIPSAFRQNEKPFNEQRVSAPISGTLNNPVTKASGDFKTVDELRSANKPKISYESRTKAGQFGNVRGHQSEVVKNKADTYYDLGHDRLFTAVGAVTGNKMNENFDNLKQTTRQDSSRMYYGGIVGKESLSFEPRLSSVDNTSELTVGFQDPKRQQFHNDYTRNIQGSTSAGDYGKKGINLPELERNTTSTMHQLNAGRNDFGSKMGIQDDIRNTLKETVLQQDKSGNIKTTFKKSATSTLDSGLSDMNFKATQKETLIDNKYLGQANKKDQMGYIVNKYEAKTTHKETVSDTPYSGGILDNNKSSMVYSTYDNPEKVRNAVHVDYMGSANTQGFAQEKNRGNYANAEISSRQEDLLTNERPSGPQHFNIAGGVNTVGEQKLTSNMLLKERSKTRSDNLGNISQNILTKTQIGQTSDHKNVYGELENSRIDDRWSNIINSQLKENPFYNLKRN